MEANQEVEYSELNNNDVQAIISKNLSSEKEYSHFYLDKESDDYAIFFSNIEFTDAITINKIPKNVRLIFSSCRFKKRVWISGVKGNYVEFSGIEAEEFHFTISDIPLVIIGTNEVGIKSLNIIKLNITNRIHLEGLFGKVYINEIKGTDKDDDYRIFINGEVQDLHIEKCGAFEFEQGGIIDKCLIGYTKVFFLQSMAIGELTLKKCHCADISGVFTDLTISDPSNTNLYLKDVSCLGTLQIKGFADKRKSAGSTLQIDKLFINDVFSIDSSFENIVLGKAEVNDNYIVVNKLIINNSFNSFINSSTANTYFINSLNFKSSILEATAKLQLHNIHLLELCFEGFYSKAFVAFNNINVGYFDVCELNLENFWIDSDIGVNPLTLWLAKKIKTNSGNDKDKTLKILNSDVGGTIFASCDFSDFSLIVENSKLINLFISDTKMPMNIRSTSLNRYLSAPQRKNANAQLKKVFEQQGDYVSSSIFYANEMNAYFDSISFVKNPWEIVNLGLNKISSDHGQNWVRALLSTIIASTFFYSIFGCLIGYTPTLPSKVSINNAWFLAGYYFEFINPVHKLDTFQEVSVFKKISTLARLWDGISRIFIAYFIFQFIQAFRKHGRSK